MISQSILDKIKRLKEEKNAVILSHYYQVPDVQDIGDYVGDSLGLCQQAAHTDADVIIFCGVWFMAESAALLNPGKTVIIPEPASGCPMANMVKPQELLKMKEQHPGAVTVCYINTNADVKALCDICCTSSNAAEVVQSIPKNREIIFVPDKHLGRYVSEMTGRQMFLWPGYCHVHQQILPEHVIAQKKAFPGAPVLVHPECSKEVIALADFTGSTGQILDYCRKSGDSTFIIGTEHGILHALEKQDPDKKYIPASEVSICPNMKKISLEKVIASLETLTPVVEVDPRIRKDALKPIKKMLELKQPVKESV